MQTLGKYELIEQLGSGGYATVHKARDPGLDRTVALKLLHQHVAGDPGFVARFRREARSAANLSHHNVVTIYELGEVEGEFYIAMRYLAGPTLAQIIEDEAPVSPERAVELLAPVAEALDYAHGRGFIHRDVKPSNVILDENGQPVLTDFGLVRAEEGASAATLSLTGMTLGTPQYMAPEQANHEYTGTIDRRCDVYSLGVVAYELLTGRPPFTGNTPLAVMMAQVNTPPPPPREENPDLSESVAAALLRALAKSPPERYESAGALIAALRADDRTTAGKAPSASAHSSLTSVGDRNGVARVIEFAGLRWYVKSGYRGPGPNYWSDSAQSVWVDGNGRLHLKLRSVNGTWYGAEVYSVEPTSHDMHRFYVDAPLDQLNENIVLGLFLYKDDQHEIDVEFSKWGNPTNDYNAQYVVQLWDTPGNRERFRLSLNGTYTTHYMDWGASSIQFMSIHGHYPYPPDLAHKIHSWEYTGNDNPLEEDNLRIRMNLWLVGGTPPSDRQEVKVVITDGNFP